MDKPTLPLDSLFRMLFQKRILLMAIVALGHHCTLPLLNLQHWFSAPHFASVLMLSIALSLALKQCHRSEGCCRIVSRLLSCCKLLCLCRISARAKLHCLTTQGLEHFSLCANGFTCASWCLRKICGSCRSIQMVQWLLGIAVPKLKYLLEALVNSCDAMKMSSVGLLPHSKVGGATSRWSQVIASTKPNWPVYCLMEAKLTLSLQSVSTTTWSPSSCHCWISFTRLLNVNSLGHAKQPSLVRQ